MSEIKEKLSVLTKILTLKPEERDNEAKKFQLMKRIKGVL